MRWNNILKIINFTFPPLGIGLMVYYDICDTSCSYLQGTFLGIDLKVVGILFMGVLLIMALPPVISLFSPLVNHLRTIMLSSAVGGEIMLVRFQIIHDTFCPFCLAFGFCVLMLFVANLMKMNKYLVVFSLLAGVLAFSLFFKGSVLPLYG